MEHSGTHDHGHDPAELKKHVRIYMVVFASLMALTLITVGISYLHLPTPAAIGLALIVASVKGSLVACYFMHLISERKLILVVMALTVFFFIGVLLGPVITEIDEIRP
jgi:cytochrome c oxidase subunit 4